MKKSALIFAVASLFFIWGDANAQRRPIPPPPMAIFQASDCSFLTWYGALCQDTDDGKLYKWDGAAIAELAATSGDGDITDVWACTTGNCNALTAASGDTMDASLANSIIPHKLGTTAELPATCSEGMVYWSSNGDAHYTCTAANTWRLDYNQSLAADANPSFGTINVVSTNSLNLGSAGSAVGQITFKNATSGGITVQPITGALGAATFVLGTTFTDAKWCTYATATGFTCNQEGPAGFVDWTADQGATNIHAGNIPDLTATYQAYDADLTTYAGITPAADIQTFLGAANLAAMKAQLSVDDLVTLSGVADGAVNLGTFTGSTIENSRTIKEALQDMETAFEAAAGHTQNTDTGTTGTTFQIDSDAAGPLLKNNTGALEARAAGDAAYIGFRALTIQGTVITATTNFAGNITGALTGNADTATAASTVVVVDSTDSSSYIAMFDSATGTMAIKTDGGLTYNASSGVLTATGFSGPITGAVTGNVTGNASTATALASNPTDCGANNFATTIAANGNLTCAQPAIADLSDGSGIALLAGAQTFTANNIFGNADTDTLTIRSMIIGGNSRAVQIAASVASPTYATGTNELYVAGDIETPGNMYANAFIGGTGIEGQRRISFSNNDAFSCASYPDSIYFKSDAMYFCNSTSSKTPARLEDTQTFTGLKTFGAGIASSNGTSAGFVDIYEASGSGTNKFRIQAQAMAGDYTLTFPVDDGTSNQVLTTDGSGVLTWASPTATAAGATAGMVQFNASGAGGALAGDAGFIFDTTTDKLTLGASGGATTGTVELYYTGTTYAATLTPNASMAADVTITLPAASGTLLTSAGDQTWTGVQTYSAASNNSTVNVLTTSGTINMNGDDLHRSLFIDHTLTAGTITGTGNVVVLIDIDAMTGDANTSLAAMRIGNLTGTTGAAGEVEYGIMVGTGWDRGLSIYSPSYFGDGTNGMTVSATGGVSFAGTATFTTASATSSVPWVVGTGTASNTAEGTAYWESDTDILTIGDGATGISLDFTANTAIVFPSASGTLLTTTGSPAAMVIASQATGDLLYASSNSAWARLGIQAAGYVLGGGAIPAWTNAPQITTIELGAASDTTIARTGAGVITVENKTVVLEGNATGGIILGDATPDAAGEIGFDATSKFLFYGGNSEDFFIDVGSAANTVTLGSNTGVTDLSIGALNLATTGIIQGGIKIASDADGMDAAAMTAAGMYGTMFIATGNGTWILPRAVLGQSICLMDSGTAHDLILDVTAGSTIRLKGTEQADGIGITNAAGTTTGDFVCVIAVATDKWSTVGIGGAWLSQ